MFPELSLDGRKAIVTGGGRGIGRAIALALAEAGADVAVAARTESEIEETAAGVRSLGRQALAIPTDVSNSGDVDSLVDQVVEGFGNVDILVNNAGHLLTVPVVPLPGESYEPPQVSRADKIRMSNEEWDTMIKTNLSSVFYCCRSVAPHMMAMQYGKIVNITSINAKRAVPLVSAYNASKAAVNMLTRVLALEWASYNICVNAIGPGEYHTKMSDPMWTDPASKQNYLQTIPLGRGGAVRELGLLAAYLASPASDYMTGQTIYLDGGLSAR